VVVRFKQEVFRKTLEKGANTVAIRFQEKGANTAFKFRQQWQKLRFLSTAELDTNPTSVQPQTIYIDTSSKRFTTNTSLSDRHH